MNPEGDRDRRGNCRLVEGPRPREWVGVWELSRERLGSIASVDCASRNNVPLWPNIEEIFSTPQQVPKRGGMLDQSKRGCVHGL
jgi:hypothetical protein